MEADVADRRVAAAQLFWADDQSTEQQLEAVAALAAHMKFRAKSVIGLPIEKKAKYLSTLPNVSDGGGGTRTRELPPRLPAPDDGAFLDSLGITHEDGLISEENVTKPDPEKRPTAAAELATKVYPQADVSLYLRTLGPRTRTPGEASLNRSPIG